MDNATFKQEHLDDWTAFQEVYTLFKQYVDISQSEDERWTALIAEADKMRLYENTLYVRLATAIIDELTVRSKEEQMREGRPC